MAKKGQKFRKWTQEEKEKIIELSLNCYSLKEIALKFNSTTGSIGTIINKYKNAKISEAKPRLPYKIDYSISQKANDLFVGVLFDYNKELIKENNILKKQWASKGKTKNK
ncbi:helix-turn-helix domain-containing protein [Spiroplasma endosymbiont of Atherix ibis]|uniref:helix-turn-helix domain-containing protein n=1 Tax=Spiroplasma endosymbiont of Atherix ibis TaxID=3066291 RepID=UPI0030CC5EF1